MTAVIAVVVGGAVGAPLRYLLDLLVTRRVTTLARPGGMREFPWGLLVVNAVGSALAGVVLVVTTGDLRTFLLVGLCGAFTTFSGFGWEASRLWSSVRPAFWAAVLVLPVSCVAAFLVAWSIATALTSG